MSLSGGDASPRSRLSLAFLYALTLAITDAYLQPDTMTPSPGAGGLGCLLVPLHLLTSYALVHYFATPQHPKTQQKKAHYSLANRVVHYEPVRRSLDPHHTDEGGRADGEGRDRRRPRDRARTVVAEEQTTNDQARKRLGDPSALANSPSSPALAATATTTAFASGNNARMSLDIVVAGSEHVDQIETKVECGARVAQLNVQV